MRFRAKQIKLCPERRGNLFAFLDTIQELDRSPSNWRQRISHNFKSTAIPATGYVYQTLVGIKLLCDWLSTPTLFEWVKFEADEEKDARGLDDIVAKRRDGMLELIQVKFTVDPFDPENALSWSWLLERNGVKGKSLLEKWSSAAFNVGLGRLGKVCLTTNRRPDRDFESHLRGAKVDINVLPDALRGEVVKQFGTHDRAALFFDRFEFAHSYSEYELLDRNIRAEFESRHTDHTGYLALYRHAIDWSIRRNSPAPDGRVTLEILRVTISERQPRPLDQDFRIPVGYHPPNSDFAGNFLDEAVSGAWDFRVLWGSPGQGKSTFLSYLCRQMVEREFPFVRHHYFLDLQDPSDRFSLRHVAHSLISQMQARCLLELPPAENDAEALRTWLAAYGKAYGEMGKRFFVVIDGLDHVWRENNKIVEPLESLFKQLLPLPPNTSLILGTQRVDATHLPSRLNTYARQEHWVELPRMCLGSVMAWLAEQQSVGNFKFENTPQIDQLGELSAAFERVSEGHPLVLTYTFMALTRISPILSVQRVDNYAPTPHGDAHAYYQSLWNRLSWEGKDGLHLVSDGCFIWPVGALSVCLNVRSTLEDEIGHLLSTVDAGLVAFHGSLHAFVSNQADHKTRLCALLPKVRQWLANEAPNYLRWAWHWLYESRLGEHTSLLTGTTQSWAIDALSQAYPDRQITRILKVAEELAFSSGDYELAIRKRWLKNRITNLTYQLSDPTLLEDYALRLTGDRYPALLLASQVNRSSISGLHQFAMLCLSAEQKNRAGDVQERMRQRINDRIQSVSMEWHEHDRLLDMYLEVAAGTGRYESAKIIALVRRHSRAVAAFENFLRKASRGSDLTPIMNFVAQPMLVGLRRILEVEAIRTSSWIDAKLHEWSDFKRFRKHPISMCWRLLYQRTSVGTSLLTIPQHEVPTKRFVGDYDESEFANYLHFLFFRLLANVLWLQGARPPDGLGFRSNRTWLDSELVKLESAAHICGSQFARGEYPKFSLVYHLVDQVQPGANDHEHWTDKRLLTRALSLISVDLFFLGKPRSRLQHIPSVEWERCKNSSLFSQYHLRDLFLSCHFPLLSNDVVHAEIVRKECVALCSVDKFNETSGALTELCGLATSYGFSELGRRLLANAFRFGLGYGWRKDWRLPAILDAVEKLSQHNPEAGIEALKRLAPIYSEIDQMTEKSGANTSDLARLLIKFMPDAYVHFYRFLLDRGRWFEAERAFSAFVETVDQDTPAVGLATAFLWDEQSRGSVRRGANPQLDAMFSLWSQDTPGKKDANQSSECEAVRADESAMPAIESFPPSSLPDLAIAVRSTNRHEISEQWFEQWFAYWHEQGRSTELLNAIEALLRSDEELGSESVLIDLAFRLCLVLHGKNKAFRWLVEAHRHRRGWTDQYGRSGSTQRVALLAQHYCGRWEEFVQQTSKPASKRYQSELIIPDVALINLLLQVGEISRARTVLQTVVDLTCEEFAAQPLTEPEWLNGRSA